MHSIAFRNLFIFAVLALVLSLCPVLLAAMQNGPAQHPSSASDAAPADAAPQQQSGNHLTPAENMDQAWTNLTDTFYNPKNTELRIQSIAALGTMAGNTRAQNMIIEAMGNPDLDVRTAASLAAGQSYSAAKTSIFSVPLRKLLDDKEPQVAFTAAATLWKMTDHSGEDILLAVAGGERKAKADVVHGTMHMMSKNLHSPATLARMGALQGATMLLGPFGIGITAFEYLRKYGGDTARADAIDLVSQKKTPAIRKELIAALGDKDPAVCASAAKALGQYHDNEVSTALLPLFSDTRAPLRLTASAAYIRSLSGPSTPHSGASKAKKS